MPAGRFEICNMALGFLAVDAIDSFDDETVQADLCRRFYDTAYRLTLERHPWNFAERSSEPLSPRTEETINEFDFAYALPEDYVAFRKMLREDGYQSTCPFRIRGRVFHTDEANPIVVYTFKVTEQFTTAGFDLAVAHKLAHLIGGPLTEDSALVNAQNKAWMDQCKEARFDDSRMDTSDGIHHYPLRNAHLSGGGSGLHRVRGET